ncbi:MAG TPA: universal stress protein [Bryobacteraceae bacterium]|nr:universal stress protein [Bryobacteraceae bacterium]
MRVLLTTDGSKEATSALRTASRLLNRNSLEAHVLYVQPQPRAPKSGKITKREYQHRLAAETKRVLEEAKKVLLEEGIDALTLCESGSPARIIMQEAEDYDLTVLGAKGRDVRSEVGLGPVASRLVEHATGCVLIGRQPPGDRQPRILVPLDGSDGSQKALDALASYFDLESAEITLLHVLETLWLPPEEEDEATSDVEENDQVTIELRREAEQLLTQAQMRILPQHPGVTTSTREGIPANEILAEADQGDYDLVVVGATGATDMKHSVLGSVSSKVAWNAPCSVLVVRIPE